MPLFGAEYEVNPDPEPMSFEVAFTDGTGMVIQPHLCSSHEKTDEDHRGYIDCVMFVSDPYGNPTPFPWSINLPLASVLVEGLSEVAPYAQMNKEIEL